MPGKNLATASLVCGILSLIFIFFGYGAFLGIVAGIAAIVLAINSKKQGYTGGTRTAGLVLGIIGTVLCCISLICCVVCASVVTAMLAELGISL